MAVTSIWPIKGRIDKVIDYARNPEKTTERSIHEVAALHAIDDVVEYAVDDMKTEVRSYVSCLNCTSEENAAAEFLKTKRLWHKTDGRVCYHGYQSFMAGEVTAEQAHNIGVALAKELWGDRFQVVIATHCNTGHYHNHFVINSVSDLDGYKFYNSPEDYRRMREVSDRLCREAKLSVIENPGGHGRNYGEWIAEKNGQPTHRGTIRADIDRAILASTTEAGFIKVMQEMGYEFKTRTGNGAPLKYPALKPPGAKGFFRFHKLGAGYGLDEIIERIYDNTRKVLPFPEAERTAAEQYRRQMGAHQPVKHKGLQALYYRYCYELHIIVRHPASVKRVSFLLREDVVKLDKYIAQTQLLGKAQIDTMEQLTDYQKSAESRMEVLTAKRSALRNRMKAAKRHGDEPQVETVKAEIAQLSKELRQLRKEVVLCTDIALRSDQVAQNLEQLTQEIEEKEATQDEHFRRSGRSGREDDPQRR